MTLLEVALAVVNLLPWEPGQEAYLTDDLVVDRPDLAVRLVRCFSRELDLDAVLSAPYWGDRLWREVGLMGAVVVVADVLEARCHPSEELSALATRILMIESPVSWRRLERELAQQLRELSPGTGLREAPR